MRTGTVVFLLASTAIMFASPMAPGQESTQCPARAEARSGTVAGQILDDKGLPLRGALVVFGDYRATTDRNGCFVVTGVRPDHYPVSVGPPSGTLLAGDVLVDPTRLGEQPALDVVAGKVTRLRRLLRAGGRLEITIRRKGVPLNEEQLRSLGPRVSVELERGSSYYSGTPAMVGGRLAFSGLPPNPDYTLRFEVPGFAAVVRQGITVTPSQVSQLALDFDPDETTGIVGTVLGQSGPVDGAEVFVTSDSGVEPAGKGYSDSAGSFRILGLAPGQYRVVISGGGRPGSLVSVEKGHLATIELRDGS